MSKQPYDGAGGFLGFMAPIALGVLVMGMLGLTLKSGTLLQMFFVCLVVLWLGGRFLLPIFNGLEERDLRDFKKKKKKKKR